MFCEDESNYRAILVDSTRRGKRMPDALSKTVPIWCTVLNRSVLGDATSFPTAFPEGVVAPQEISHIERLIHPFVASFKVAILRIRLTAELWSRYRTCTLA